jgi:hypothetical protein
MVHDNTDLACPHPSKVYVSHHLQAALDPLQMLLHMRSTIYPLQAAFHRLERRNAEFSTTSLTLDRSMISPCSSISSGHNPYAKRSRALPSLPVTPNKTADLTPSAAGGNSTDPAIIHAITQTMIGEFLYKYTRRAIGKGHGEHRHKRFFWVHPYTKTLYWSSADPGSSNVSESSAKSGMFVIAHAQYIILISLFI